LSSRVCRAAHCLLVLALGFAFCLEAASASSVSDPQLQFAVSSALPGNGEDVLALTNLWACNFGIVDISGIEAARHLQRLDLSGNAIASLAPLTNLTELQSLTLDGNPCSDISPVSALTNLTSLSLSGKAVVDISPLANLSRLLRLSIHSSQLDNLQVISNLTSLQELVLYHDGFTNIAPLAGLTNLKTLDLRWNYVANPSVLSSLTNLNQLLLGSASITNLSFLAPLVGLEHLDLSQNRLTSLDPIQGLTNLSYLVLSGNDLLSDYGALRGFGRLAGLELRGNGLAGLECLSGLGNLKYVDIANNHASDLSPLREYQDLSVVLDSNQTLDPIGLVQLTNVTRLWLESCEVTNVAFLTNMSQLTAVGLSRNPMYDPAPLAALSNLTLLDLSGTAITNYNMLASMPRLESLRLDGNLLGSGFSLPSNQASLAFLSLNDNRLIDLASLSVSSNLSSVYIDRNRFCDIGLLTNQPQLRFLDAGANLLHEADARRAVQIVRSRWVNVGETAMNYLPTNQMALSLEPPMTPEWHVPVDRTRSFQVLVSDLFVPYSEWLVYSVDLSEGALSMSVFWTNETVTCSLSPGVTGIFTNLLVVSDSSCGLSVSTNIVTHVDPSDSSFCIPSHALSNAVWSAVGRPAGGLASPDLLNLTFLSVQSVGLGDLSGLQWASNLVTLDLTGNAVTGVAELANLTHLTSVLLDANSLSNLSILQPLTSLTSLSLSSNSLASLAGLERLTNLASLNIEWNPLTDFSALSSLPNVAALNLVGDSISDLSFMTNLTGLTFLDLSLNRVSDLSPLVTLTNLTYLDLSQNRLTDISALTNLSKLAVVNVQYNLLAGYANTIVASLRSAGVQVIDSPQRTPPSIDIRTNWIVGPLATFATAFDVSDSGPSTENLKVGVVCDNPGLNCSLNLLADLGAYETWSLGVFASTSAVGVCWITINATNDVGLSSSQTLMVTIVDRWEDSFSGIGSSNLVLFSEGANPWFQQSILTFHGQATAQSGAAGNLQSSVLQATNISGPGRLSFWWRVSSETNYDWLDFEMAGQSNRISGETGWQQRVFPVPAGPQTPVWTYYKDRNTSRGLDAGWLAQVTYEPGAWIEAASRPANGMFPLLLHGAPTYELQVSTDLRNWVAADPGAILTNVSVLYIDTNTAAFRRFYRLHDTAAPP
jgi:internalin A